MSYVKLVKETRLGTAVECDQSNWGRGYCKRRTMSRCDNCGHPVCGTHKASHLSTWTDGPLAGQTIRTGCRR